MSPSPTALPTATPRPSPTPGAQPDSDGDGFGDALEIWLGADPLNNRDIPRFGDVDGDGATGILDALRLMARLRSEGSPLLPYNPLFDVNLDGQVDARDARLLYRWAIAASECLVLPCAPGE